MSATPPTHTLRPSDFDALLMDTTPWLSCDECFDRMDGHVEVLVRDPDYRDAAMDRHLRGCAACDEEARSLLALVAEGPAEIGSVRAKTPRTF